MKSVKDGVKKKTLLIISLAFVAGGLLVIGVVSWDSARNSRFVERCKEIELGMSRAEVLQKMRAPYNMVGTQYNKRSAETLFFPGPRVAATNPQITIDVGIDRVVSIVCSDNYRIK